MAVTSRLSLQLLNVGDFNKELILNGSLTTLDNAALVTIANTFSRTPDATANYGNINIGDGGFAGSAGHYAGAAGGTYLAVNKATAGTADVYNYQINGVSKQKLGSGGNITLGDGVNLLVGTTTGTQIGTTTSQKIGMWGATPVVQRPGTTDLRQVLLDVGALASGGATPCNLNGGQLTAGVAAFSGGLKGSGSSLQFSRLAFTFAADADEALTVSTKENPMLDIQAGVITTTRTLDVVAPNAGGFWIVINRNANPVNVKIGANTAITVGATRSRILCAPGGTNMFSLTQDNNYTL